jgi:hypothetical protein
MDRFVATGKQDNKKVYIESMQEQKRKLEHEKLAAKSAELVIRYLQGCSARTRLRRQVESELQTNLTNLDKLAAIFYA